MYPISGERQNFRFKMQFSSTQAIYDYDIPTDRDYTGTSFASTLQSIIRNDHANFSVLYDQNANKLTFQHSVSFRFLDTDADAYFEMGIIPSTTYSLFVVADNPVDLSGTKYVDVVTDLAHTTSFCSSGVYSPIARVPTRASFGEIVQYEPPFQSHLHSKDNTDQIRLQLRDDRGKLIDLGENGHVSYTFQLKHNLNQ